MTPVGRQAELFIAMCAIDTKIDGIVTAMPPFSVSEPLQVSVPTSYFHPSLS